MSGIVLIIYVHNMYSYMDVIFAKVRVSAYQALGPFIATFASDDFNFASRM